MTAQPTYRDYNGELDGNSLRTLRVWVTEPCEDIVSYIHDKGLKGAISDAIPLDESRPAGNEGRHPKHSFLVDLAVPERERNRVVAHFPSPAPAINDVSLINLHADSAIPERQILLRHYLVYKRYLQRYAQRKIEGNVSSPLNAWYNMRFAEISNDIRESLDILQN
ncbi:hypothetical protein PENSTE_c023G04279 [Penicillium steckii]|uniref:Uncharacterized protein n=1 Tax=Penicillium steckii TaxID=303698 RepID=A0A1V6SS86_9EURO|nr:hypothetical protein PENSTE_c023G04279 [Penicillium steckii]